MSSPTTLVSILRQRGISDERVLAAIAQVDRSRFVGPEYAAEAWDDKALPIGSGQTISQPYIVALMTEALALSGGERVLEVGTGSGYQAAVLAQLCREVVTIERHAELSRRAAAAVRDLGINNVTVRLADGTLGAPEAGPFAGILVTAGAPRIPKGLADQLSPEGRLVIPVGTETTQELLLVQRAGDSYVKTSLCDCRFVPLIGQAGWNQP